MMLDPKTLTSIRTRLNISQEQMARLLGVSFASVNRWEGGHSSPSGPIVDLYKAINAAMHTGYSPDDIRRAANAERESFLLVLFQMAYAKIRRRR